MKLKRLISCGLVGILTGVGILMNTKVSSAEDSKFTKVLDVNDLCAGDIISIVNEVNKTAMSTTQNKNNRVGTTIEINDGCFEASSDVQRILLESGTVENTYAFNVSNGYLYASSSKNNYLVTNDEIDANASWKISISNGNATIKATGSNTRNLIRYNSNNKLFSCYSSGQNDVQIYKLEKNLSYSVSFFDGTEEYMEYAKTVEENGKLERPENPKKDGYVFDGWYIDSEFSKEYDFDSSVTADLKLYAKFEEEASVTTHTVTFMKDFETTYNTLVVKEGNKVGEPEDPTNDGYSFGGWYTDVNCTTPYDFNTPVNEDITLYAKWLAKYTVSFDTDGGSTVESQAVVTGNKATKPALNPTKKGYNFVGWYTDNTYTTEFDFENTIITDNTTIYAKFEDASIFKLDGYTFNKINTLEELTTGYYVIGGFDNNNNSYYMNDKIGDGFFEVKSNPIAYVKIYEKNNKVKIQLSDLYINTKAVKNKPYDFDVTDSRKDAHEFVPKMVDGELQVFVDESSDSNVIAMNVASNVSPKRIKPYKKIATANSLFNITLFKAQNVKPFHVTFKGPNNEELNKEEMLPHQKAPEFEAPKKPGHKFMGWYKEGTDVKYDFTTELSEDIVLVAKYEALTPAELFEQLEIKNQLAYHWQTEDSTTYTIDNVSLRFGVNLTEEMKSLEGVKFGAFITTANILEDTDLKNDWIKKDTYTSASEVYETYNELLGLKYLEFTNIASEGGMTSLRLDNLDSALDEEFVVVIYMEYDGKLYVTEQKIASVKEIADEYLVHLDDLGITDDNQIESLKQLSK